jgi:outer membrane protein assembly factor BamE (lipoprotein component of BamABCDE complex)
MFRAWSAASTSTFAQYQPLHPADKLNLMKIFAKSVLYYGAIIFSLILTVTAGCSSRQTRTEKDIQAGMSKAEVLEIAGSPTRTTREFGQDRWTYDRENTNTTYIYFSEGVVTHAGPQKLSDTNVNPPDQKQNFKPVGE